MTGVTEQYVEAHFAARIRIKRATADRAVRAVLAGYPITTATRTCSIAEDSVETFSCSLERREAACGTRGRNEKARKMQAPVFTSRIMSNWCGTRCHITRVKRYATTDHTLVLSQIPSKLPPACRDASGLIALSLGSHLTCRVGLHQIHCRSQAPSSPWRVCQVLSGSVGQCR